MSINAKQIKKINYFSKVPEDFCSELAKVVEQKKCSPGTSLLKEGEAGDTMLLIFQGQVEVSKNMMVKTPSGFTMSTKSIIRLETTDPAPANNPISEPTVSVVKAPAFGIGEFSLVLDNAKRTSHVTAMTDIEYGILSLDDFSNMLIKRGIKVDRPDPIDFNKKNSLMLFNHGLSLPTFYEIQLGELKSVVLHVKKFLKIANEFKAIDVERVSKYASIFALLYSVTNLVPNLGFTCFV